jgi:hypothetical protein
MNDRLERPVTFGFGLDGVVGALPKNSRLPKNSWFCPKTINAAGRCESALPAQRKIDRSIRVRDEITAGVRASTGSQRSIFRTR